VAGVTARRPALPVLALACLLCGGRAPGRQEARAVYAAQETHESREPEYRVKAAFLFHFVRYTTWPESCFPDANAPIELLIVGTDPFRDELAHTFDEKLLHGRHVVVRHALRPPEELHAQLVFCCGLAPEDAQGILVRAAEKPVLLFADEDGLAERGYEADFYLDGDRVRFEINAGAARRAGLGMSSELLKLARIVGTRR